ncbi:hypothetical protein [Sinosporangium siamense]|uniref:Uncharacterized protein n=1 Tax=Sinosporangium siamense TaxID=1367973 RepID=A0A919RQ75_9ACTN|nr:hypothetical protein [Sinosporangium siamense]GII96204.1 hypothetical protein Ssi02_64350 [Sinosporangium siamense]
MGREPVTLCVARHSPPASSLGWIRRATHQADGDSGGPVFAPDWNQPNPGSRVIAKGIVSGVNRRWLIFQDFCPAIADFGVLLSRIDPPSSFSTSADHERFRFRPGGGR